MRTTILTRSQLSETRPPVPPFGAETALQKVHAAESAWNTRDPDRVAAAYTRDAVWRNRDEFITRPGGDPLVPRPEMGKGARLRTAQGSSGHTPTTGSPSGSSTSGTTMTAHWFRSYGNELWEFAENGLMRRREASINDVPIDASERRIAGPRPDGDVNAGSRCDEPPCGAAVAVSRSRASQESRCKRPKSWQTALAGDRLVHVRGPEGVRTSRRQFRLLGLRGTLELTAPRSSMALPGHHPSSC